MWARIKAENDFWGNDSVHVQFSDSVDASGSPSYQIGTSSATSVILEDCRRCGLSGWGWQDNGWAGMGPAIYFAQAGQQTIRIQSREDGISIDQIVLSPQNFFDTAPGSLKDDTTILPKNSGRPPSNLKPHVTIQASLQSGRAPLPVSFTANASDPDGSVAGYSWDFGDGQTSTKKDPSHSYGAAGIYTADVTVTDNDGAKSTATVVITVTSASGGTSLKVLTWNVHKGVGTDDSRNLNRIADWIANLNPDIVALCEIMRFSADDDDDDTSSSADDQPQYIVDRLESKTKRTWYLHWMPIYPGAVQGTAIASKFPFLSKSGKYLSHQRSVSQVEVRVGGQDVNFFGTHLSVESASWRIDQVQELEAWMNKFSGPRIVGGDFNAGSTTNEIEMFTSSYYDAWAEAVKDGTDTAYADNTSGRTRRSRIDYLFYGKNTANLVLKGARVPDMRNLKDTHVDVELGTVDDKGVRPSDHNAVMATFEVR
ncbi:MAG: endonuclease/exonuclease/phosphatase family protein [Pyrinomonadaceae bacterium]